MNRPKSEPITLKEFAALLSKVEDPRKFFSDVFTQAQPHRLCLQSDADLLNLLLLFIPMRGLPSVRTTQMTLLKPGMSEEAFHGKCLDYLNAHPFFKSKLKENKKTNVLEPLKAKKDPKGAFLYDTLAFEEADNKIPAYLSSSIASKLSSALLLEFCNERGKVEDRTGKDKRTAIEKILGEVLSSISTHPAKLMSTGYNGGYCRVASAQDAQDWGLMPWAVHEFDFDVPSPEALTCSAGYQSWSKVVLALVEYEGKLQPIYKVLGEQKIRNALKKVLVANCEIEDLSHKDTVIQTLALTIDCFETQPSPSKVDLKQVFVGQFASERGSRLINVAMPVAVFHEFDRVLAKQGSSLEEGHTRHIEGLQSKLDETQDRLDLAQEDLKLQKKLKPRNPALEQSLQLQIKRDKETIKGLKAAVKTPDYAFKRLPATVLGFGGDNPQNVASGLSSRHHNSNLLVKIPFIASKRKKDASKRRAYYEESLLQTPRIQYPAEKLPWFLRESFSNKQSKEAVRELAVTLAMKSLARVFELRDVVQAERDLFGSAKELATRLDAQKVGLTPEIESLVFDTQLAYATRKKLAQDLSNRVGERVLTTLKNGFKEPLSLDKKKDVLKAINALCLQELV